MTTRRTILLAATGALATSVAGCGDGAAAATGTAPEAAAAPVPAPIPAPATSIAAREAWAARSTAVGVVAAFDFSATPANGGTWIWGSLSASPKVTVELTPAAQFYKSHFIDTDVAPPGSTASLRFEVPGNSGERSDMWRVSIDNYADQFGENSEFWVQWRTRMNGVMARQMFRDKDPSGLYTTTYKHTLFGEGMQSPSAPEGIPRKYYGYQGASTQTDNVLQDARSDSDHELALIGGNGPANHLGPGLTFKYPVTYHSKFFYGTDTRGQDSNYYTYHNSGNEGKHLAACQFTSGPDTYTDASTCFQYPVDEWFTLMYHCKLGPYGTAISGLTGTSMTGYTNSTLEVWAAYEGGAMQLLHRRTGVVLRTDAGLGPQGVQKYGTFGWMTFMTHKDVNQAHDTGKTWVSQIIVKSGSVPPSTPL